MYKGKNYAFMMNGQTGRLAGRLPADTGKCWKYRFLLTGISGAVLTLGVLALRLFAADWYHPILFAVAWGLALAIGFGVVNVWKSRMNTALRKTHACDYAVQGSLSFRQKKDRFLYSNVVRTRRVEQGSAGRMGGGRGRR